MNVTERWAMRHRYAVASAIIAVVLAGTACADAAAVPSVPAGATSTATTTTAPTTTTSAVATDPVELTAGLPRTVDYVWLETTVTGATIASIEPRTFLRDEWAPTDTTYLFLTLEVANRSEREGLILTPNPYSIAIGGLEYAASDVLDGRPHIGLAPLGTEGKVLAFEVPVGTTFDGVSLLVNHDDRIPAVLPLVGDLPVDAYPVSAGVSGAGPAQGSVSGCNQALDVTMLGGTIDIELAESDAPPTVYGSRRAYVGERFLSLEVRVHNNGGSRCGAGGTNYDPRLFRLLVDGVPHAPATFLSGIIAAETAEDLVVNFTFPVDATSVEFAVGSDDATLFTAPVDITDLPAEPTVSG